MKTKLITTPDFPSLGALVFSRGVAARSEADAVFCDSVSYRLQLFRNGDWGDIDEENWDQNVQTCKQAIGGQLLGQYKLPDGSRIWILTVGYARQILGHDYCYTTILFPDEYRCLATKLQTGTA
jgi:hypothetical protein